MEDAFLIISQHQFTFGLCQNIVWLERDLATTLGQVYYESRNSQS